MKLHKSFKCSSAAPARILVEVLQAGLKGQYAKRLKARVVCCFVCFFRTAYSL